MKNKPFTLVLLGPPGSGKGTQGTLLAEKMDGNYIVVGDLIREIYKEGPIDKFHKDLIERYDKGIVQPDKTMSKILDTMLKRIAESNLKEGLIFDAYPLAEGQIKDLNKIVKKFKLQEPIVFYIDISDEEAQRRLSKKRLTCVSCKKKVSHVPAESIVKFCHVCEGQLVERSDDTPEVIKTRLDQYRIKLKPVLQHFEDKGQLIRINGEQSVEAVFAEIWEKLKPRT